MAKRKGLFKRFYQLLLPVIILGLLAVGAAAVFLVHKAAHPKANAYLVTPERYGQLSVRGALVTEEKWPNRDGTGARGWLLRGMAGLPAVVLLHRYGADRSHVLDLGIKINESTNFSILMPDQRGHGPGPSVQFTSLGGCESDDALASIEFLRNLKSEGQTPLVGKQIGLYGVEMGALVALKAASKDDQIKALVLDSVPLNSNQIMASAVGRSFPFATSATSKIASYGTYLYYYDGCYGRDSACDLAKSLDERKVLLLAGTEVPVLQESTAELSRCFTVNTVIETKTDFNPSGYNRSNASLEQLTIYDQKVVEFFSGALKY